MRHDDGAVLYANGAGSHECDSGLVRRARETLYGIRRLINEGALQLVQTDILIGGGYTGLMRIAGLCEAYHIPIAPHGAQFPDVNCHFVAAVPNGLMVPACPEFVSRSRSGRSCMIRHFGWWMERLL